MKEKYEQNIKLIHLGIIILCLMVLIFSFTTSYAQSKSKEPIVMVLSSHEMPGGVWVTDFFEPWLAELERRTGGRVKVEAHYAEELAKVPDAFDAATKGVVDIAQFMPPMNPGRFPMDEIFMLPPYDDRCLRPSRVYWELFKKYPEMQKPYAGVKTLWLGTTFMTAIATKKKPILTLEDNKGMKMIVSGKWAAIRGESLGWTPLAIPPSGVYTALERGVADGGGIAALFCLRDFKWGDHLKHVTLVPFNRTIFSCVMNIDKWNSLPKDIQEIIDGMTDYVLDLFDKVQLRAHRDRMASAPKEFGTKFYTLTPEEISRWIEVDKSVAENLIADFEKKGLPGRDFYNDYIRLEKKYSSQEFDFK
ncbi:MAG: TRAP transporter substrate-binding protein DctP [Deltaproteobacteria bacterium]|nr:TRAP transporter substrate-binding protein DctP [Deltaproteobacteria bacterium]